MSDSQDLYAVMGVPRTATEEDIRSAYRRLALRWHPDRNPGDKAAEESFKAITRAYETLSDPERRRAYDVARMPANWGFRGSGTGAGATVSLESFLGPLEDVVGSFFSSILKPVAGARGHDIRVQVTIGLREAVGGATKDLDLACRETCQDCGGSGTGPSTKAAICVHCAGSGTMETGAGFISIRHTCHHCGGTGWSDGPRCARCSGVGLVAATRPVTLNIPAGVRDGTRLRFAGQGEPAARGGARGDLFCEVRVSMEKTA